MIENFLSPDYKSPINDGVQEPIVQKNFFYY